MNFILGTKVLFCGNWQNIFCLFLWAILKKVRTLFRAVFTDFLNFRQNKLHTSRFIPIFVNRD